MRKRLFAIAIVLGLAALGASGVVLAEGLGLSNLSGRLAALAPAGDRAGPAATTRPARGEASPEGTVTLSENDWRNLTVETVEARSFRPQFSTEGKIATDEDRATPVISPYAGRVVRIIARPGDVVKAGDVLCTIEATDMVQAQNDYIAAASGLDKARTTLELAVINEKRQRDLYQGRAATLRDFEQAQADLRGAQADMRAAEASLAAAANRLRILGKTEDEVTRLRARGTINPETPIVAPLGGLVVQRKIGPGQFVQGPGGDPLYVIDDVSTVWLSIFVREGDSTFVDVGDEVEFRTLARPGEVFRAAINHVGTLLDPATRRLTVRATVPNPNGVLRQEMFAGVTVFTERARDMPAVPRRAVIRDGADSHVWAAVAPGRVMLRRIKTGLVQNGFVEVTDGLVAGDRIVVQGALFLDQMAQDSGR